MSENDGDREDDVDLESMTLSPRAKQLAWTCIRLGMFGVMVWCIVWLLRSPPTPDNQGAADFFICCAALSVVSLLLGLTWRFVVRRAHGPMAAAFKPVNSTLAGGLIVPYLG